jgi:hypothetical protein
MNFEDRVKAVAEFGFTERQAGFLVTVMLHSGVCVPREYASFARTAYGHNVTKFFDKLGQQDYAAVCDCLHNRAALYHVKHHALYRAIGQPHSRYRRPVAARQVFDRLMRLDAIVLHPELMWLGTEAEKVAFFGLMAPSLPRERLLHITVGSGASRRVRFFPDDQPIAVTSTGHVVFTYVVSTSYLEEFRAFVQRHADLLRALPGWTVKVLVPRPLANAMEAFTATARTELTWTLRDELLSELKWYFNQCRSTASPRGLSFEDEEFWRDQAAFAAPRYKQLYRRWLTDGDSVFEALSSGVIAEALERGTGSIEAHVLLLWYRHLSPVAKLVRPHINGVERGDISSTRPQPLAAPSSSLTNDHFHTWCHLVDAGLMALSTNNLRADGSK